MKIPILLSIVSAFATSLASAADYSVFRVCQDQRVIRTSDGAEAGRVEYIVVDPSSHQVISTVVSGGVIGEKLVAIPYTSLRFDGDRGITLTEITRERLVSAPIIERTQISASFIQPTVIERTTTHFSGRATGETQRSGVSGEAVATPRNTDPRSNAEAAPRNGATVRSESETGRNSEERNGNRTPGSNTRSTATEPANSREDTNRSRPGANTDGGKARKETTNADPQAGKEEKPHSAASKNEQENKDTNPPPNDSRKTPRDENAKPGAQPERATEDANARKEADTKRGIKPPTDRNAGEEAAAQDAKRGAKAGADRNTTEDATKSKAQNAESPTGGKTKRPSKPGAPEATEEKRKDEQRSPQL